jgi:hypothetical protein
MSVTTAKRPPTGLGPRGRALYRRVLENYTLTSAEEELVRNAAMASDHLHRIELALAQSKMTCTGSQGQLVGNPLLSEWRAHSEVIRKIAQQLDLPDLVPAKPAPARKKSRGRIAAVHLREA